MQIEQLFGRQILSEQLSVASSWQSQLIRRPAMMVTDQWVICQRCGQRTVKQTVWLPRGDYYCPHCFQLGRVTASQWLWSLPEPNQFAVRTDSPLDWTGELTAAQKACSRQIDEVFTAGKTHLLWAVTGAGKTEMLFYGIEQALKKGLRIGIASPRIDVCLELAPRFQAAFTSIPQVVLYGEMKRPYHYCQLTICTTHQLLRFYHAFDILVVDEVDAFPFAADPGLNYAAEQAKKEAGALLYLTATPSKALLRQEKQKQLTVSYLPARYHGYPLPEIKLKLTSRWRQSLAKQHLPSVVKATLKKMVTQKRRFLLFVPRVSDLTRLQAIIKLQFSALKTATVHAGDVNRHEKVQQMRDGVLDCLITTTILERGVTFADIDVIVLGADDAVFSTAALVQIAGRAGRKAEFPEGLVAFFAEGQTRAIKEARRQIKFVNRKARQTGLLRGDTHD
ncbi:competence protein ComFA [Secundilactobacillus pentosiphilus]|uniref:Competence protein ComFA n=1 Tax=Secundilactobacillus pentosiphilus TaxID=1714682 RepID=A0A1Z5INK9_9LACO|nr:helicase-related protein [Secundilactobacillus pentosiphilus]GAX03218.1 competence protein ComFA [Secundilactobacillus pentosiphilus]